MLISIIVVIKNPGESLYKTIDSIIYQSYCSLELVIIDGESTDGSLQYISSIKDNRIRVISENDKGIYDAMNKGLKVARGELVNFMNAGDYFVEIDAIEKVVEAHNQIQSKIYCLNLTQGLNRLFSNFFVRNLCHQTIFYNRGLYNFRYNLEYGLAADFEVLLSIVGFDYESAVKYIDAHVYYDTKGISSINRQQRYREKIQIMLKFIHLDPTRTFLTIIKLRLRLFFNV